MLLQVVSLNPDAFSGQEPQTDQEKVEMAQDEKDVRQVCQYLRDSAIPELVRDLKETDISLPMDGTSLSRLLHKRGINVRYIGAIASLCKGDVKLNCLGHLCTHEMVSRSFKHVASAYMRSVPTVLISACVSHLLNCLLGHGFNIKPEAYVDPALRQLYPKADLGFETATPEDIRSAVEEQVVRRFRYTLEPSWQTDVRPLQLLRQVSLQLGLQLQAKQYAFEALPPPVPSEGQPTLTQQQLTSTESKKKRKAKDKEKGATPTPLVAAPFLTPSTFTPDDIVNLVPVVKHSCPRSALAEEALEAGRLSLAQDQRKIGQELLLESLSLHEQIYGILHPEVARAYGTLSNLYFQLDDKEAAVELARKAVIVSERTLGLDAAETLLNYLNLSLFLHQAGDSNGALVYSRHALELIGIVYGPNHPDSITTINNAAVMLQSLKAFHESRIWFQESLRVCEIVYGKQSINSATLLFQLAQALALDHDSKGAVSCMRDSYSIFLSELGSEDRNTKEAENWLEQLTQNAVSIAKHARDVQAKRIRAGIRFPPKDNPLAATRPTELPSASSSIGGARPAGSSQIDSRSIDELMKFIEGTDVQAHSSTSNRQGRGNPKRRGQSTR
jgi:protein TIF31